MAKASALKLQDINKLVMAYHAVQSRLTTLSEMWNEIRAGGNKYLETLHKKVFHKELNLEGHGRLEGATAVMLHIPHNVEDAHMSDLQKIGQYSEALVGLGWKHENSEYQAVARDLQTFCTSLVSCARHMGDGMEVFEACSTEQLFFEFVQDREAYFERLMMAPTAGPKQP